MKSTEYNKCTFSELLNKEIIDISTGEKLGFADDLKLNMLEATIMGLVIYGRPKYFGIFGPCEHTVIPFKAIQMVGKDTILIEKVLFEK